MNKAITEQDLIEIAEGINYSDNLMTADELEEYLLEYNEYLIQIGALNDSLTEQYYGIR